MPNARKDEQKNMILVLIAGLDFFFVQKSRYFTWRLLENSKGNIVFKRSNFLRANYNINFVSRKEHQTLKTFSVN